MFRGLVWILAAAAWLTGASGAAAEAGYVPVHGYLTDADGAPVDGPHRLTLQLFDADADGTQVHVEDYPSVDIEAGNFVVYLGTETPLDLLLFRDYPALWLEVVIDGSEVVSPRTQLGSVPYAGYAQSCGDTSTLDGKPPSAYAAATYAVPPGLIAMFAGACPAGWSEYTALRGRFPRGNPAGDPGSLASGGSDDAVVVAHDHSVTGTTNTDSHSHSLTLYRATYDATAGGPFGLFQTSGGTAARQTSSDSHAHTVNGTAASEGVSGTGRNMPAYREVIFCIKD